ncbi:TetR/AcrR family transcriptional regulator [Paenibacillus flagellatus]|uniref:TetR family transcriptional regulator n=1 Tax=Paenibacillus flagellatus TaxID=2211139 RepID=A0A2V5KXU6_9BACL|nr:TetR family transcriptional regulator [Paenibacillus flagellatus]PYI57357.1 TetR family transcriptional regulator [Paenibacillus flagellatus]
MTADDRTKPGLRERKKAKTKSTIQQNALRLFREQGYHETTIEQIADASDVSPSTLFRYFPTKEALVTEDDFDPMLIEAFRAQPPELTPIRAFREAIKTSAALIPDEERRAIRERMSLTMAYPELRAAMLNNTTQSVGMLAELIGGRLGRSGSDLSVLTYAGAITGTVISSHLFCSEHPEADYIDTIDEALEHLESSFRL